MPPLPNVLIIGAQKSATSSLHHYLGQHPQAFMSAEKELNFFAGPGWSWDRGLDWYADQFAGSEEAIARGESSPSYTVHPWVEGVPGRIREIVPDVKLIYLVRDPIDRIVSQYVHHRTRGYTRRSLSEIFAIDRWEELDYVWFSRYAHQLEQYLAHFDERQILVLDQFELRADQGAVLDRVFEFVGIERGFRTETFASERNVARERPIQRALTRASRGRINGERYAAMMRRVPPLGRLDESLARPVEPPTVDALLRERLQEFLAPDVERLRVLAGLPLSSWSV